MADQLRIVVNALNKFAEKHIKIIVLDAVANLVEDTPRKTGWARANWIPGIGVSPKVDGTPPAEEASAGGVASRSQQREQGIATVAATYTLDKGKVYITNSVPYITKLNEGSSKQAPAGFVQSSILRAITQSLTRL